MPTRSLPRIVTCLLALFAICRADTVRLDNGSLLVGEITAIRQGKVSLKTDFAGTLSVPLERIAALQTTGPLRVAVRQHGETTGTLAIEEDKLEISGPETLLVAAKSDLVAAGPANQPLERKTPAPAPPPADPRWGYEASVAYRARTGNTENTRLHLGAAAEKKWDKKTLKFYATWLHAENRNRTTENELIGGADFERQLNERFLWYARTELEQDEIEQIDLRATLASGIGWYAVRNDSREVRLRSGLQYRWESYDHATPDDSSFGLELGARHVWKASPWGRLVNDVVYSSDFEDWADYRIVHESSFDIPLARSRHWRLRLGLSHEYNNQVAPKIERLDTSYFLRLVFNWK